MIRNEPEEHDAKFRGNLSTSMDDFVKKIFVACDKDRDGYLDRSDLEEVRKQIGLEGNISEILEQFGASQTGKISYSQFFQFCENSALLCGEFNQSSSDSSPEYYSTDSETQVPLQMAEKGRARKEEIRKDMAGKQPQASYQSTFDMELELSHEKIKQLAAAWDSDTNPHRKSAGGIEDYLDHKTLLHLEKLKIIDPLSSEKNVVNNTTSNHGRHEYPIETKNIKDDARETSGPDYLEMSKRLHLAALTSYKNEIYDLNSRLQLVRDERDDLRKQQSQWNYEKQKMQQDFEEKLQSQTMRITELQSVIAELRRKLNKADGNVIIEEEEDEEEGEEDDEEGRSGSTSDLEVQGSHGCSECSCENCDHHLDDEGPNQVNFLATAHDTIGNDLSSPQKGGEQNPEKQDGDDLQKQLSRVLGALEGIGDRKTKKADQDMLAPSETDISSSIMAEVRNVSKSPEPTNINAQAQLKDLLNQVDSLKRDKRTLEKQLHDISVQGYVYQKGNTTHVEEEFSKLRQENNYLRSKLRKSEQEVEDVKTLNLTIREEKERLRKKNRSLQDSIEARVREPSPIPSTGSAGSGHRRSHSTHLDRSYHDRSQSPQSLQRSSSAVSETRGAQQNTFQPPHRSASLDNRSPILPRQSPNLQQRSASEARKHSLNSPSHSTNSLPSHPSSAFVAINSKGYTISPESSLRRGQHMESSDLGSSIGDDTHRSEISKAIIRNLHGRIPETLLHTLLTYHTYDQVLRTLAHHFLAEVDEKSKEGAINVERLESRMAHLQSQNDLLQLSLDESKQNAERLSLLCGKYESNSTAWSLAVQNTEHLLETYEVMLQLQESEADIYAANCHAAGIGNFDTIKSLTSTKSSHSNISIASSSSQQLGYVEEEDMIKSYHSKRKDAETQAKSLLHKLDKKYENAIISAEEKLKQDSLDRSYKSRTSTGSSQNSVCTDTLSKDEEHRLRSYIKRLKTERGIYKGTVVELESVHEYSDNPTDEGATLERAERTHELNMDIETAVILQEMQALKEERAELKHRIYLLEKEKRALELKMNSREAQEQAYIVHIEHLKSEVKEQIKKRKLLMKDGKRPLPSGSSVPDDETLSTHSSSTHSTTPGQSELLQYSSTDEIPVDLIEASRRERKLKHRIQELVDTLEKLSKNSEIRHKQTAEYISDLKRANGALVTAYEKAKKRHASRLKKFEQQLVQMAEKYQIQVRALKEQIAVLKETPPGAQLLQTETSL